MTACSRPDGTTSSLSGGTLWLAELEYGVNQGKTATYLPGTYKIGGWRETGTFTDQLTDAPVRHGDWGVYAIADQTVWRRTPARSRVSMYSCAWAGHHPTAIW
jgi:porin